MGACKYSKAWKNCATCCNWMGVRQVAADKETVTVDSSAAGVCEGFWKGSRKFGNSKCSEWAMCEELKKP